MAEIDIEKKKPVWPWILLGLVILALLLFLVFANDDDNRDDADDTEMEQQDTIRGNQLRDTIPGNDTIPRGTAGEGVSTYLNYIEDRSQMGVDQQYTNDALIHLVNAVESKAREINYDISEEITPLQQEAERISQDPPTTDHAEQIKETGTKIAEILQDMQEENYLDLSNDVEEVKTAVQEIDPSVETVQQSDEINRFFNESADVLRKMSS